MIEILIKRIANIFTVKSLVTLALTGAFVALTIRGTLPEGFMTIYTVVIGFYFGIQSTKESGKGGGDE